MPETSAPVCLWRRLSQRLAAIVLVAVSPLGAVAWAAPPAVCQVALPDRCDGPSADRTHPLVVRSLAAANADECFARAREAAAGCSTSRSVADDVVARFVAGAVERKRKVLASGAPAAQAAAPNLPIVYDAGFGAEFEQYGYSPGFTPGGPSIDATGRLLVRAGDFLQTQERDGSWRYSDMSAAAGDAIRKLNDVHSFQWTMNYRVAFSDQAVYSDAKGILYTLVQGSPTRLLPDKRLSYRPYLLYSKDAGASWNAVAIAVPDDRPSWRATLEHNDGNNDRSGAPPVLVFDLNSNFTARSGLLALATFEWKGDRLAEQDSVVLSDKSLLSENHSGGANSLVSSAERVYVVFPAMRTGASAEGGTPAHLVIYNKKLRRIESEQDVGIGGLSKDVDDHNIPAICIGKAETVHLILPGHQEDLLMRSGSLGADGRVSWTPAQPIGEAKTKAGGYTYISLNCDDKGGVVVVTRWAGDAYHFKLVMLSRASNGTWRTWKGRKHLEIVDPGRAYYGVWRHKVAQDRDGTLYLFYSYYANHLTARELAALEARFPFEDWADAKEVVPPQCVRGPERRCWIHPMPQVTKVLLRADASGQNWQFIN